MLRILVDEDRSRFMAPALVQAGFDAVDARDVGLRKKPDWQVFAYAQSDQRVFLTGDQAFGSIVAFPPGTHSGIVLVAFPNSVDFMTVVAAVVKALLSLPESEVTRNLVVIEPDRIRIRKPGSGSGPTPQP